jgi:hypothetical protein
MINSVLEATMRSAIELEENINEDGSINWSFVDADAYMDCSNLFRSNVDFYQAFNDIADKIEAEQPVDTNVQLELLEKYPNAEEQIDILKSDYLGQ